MPHLFSPIKIKNKEIKNRIVMPYGMLRYAGNNDLYQKNIRTMKQGQKEEQPYHR